MPPLAGAPASLGVSIASASAGAAEFCSAAALLVSIVLSQSLSALLEKFMKNTDQIFVDTC